MVIVRRSIACKLSPMPAPWRRGSNRKELGRVPVEDVRTRHWLALAGVQMNDP
jgi:hypothetical protein